MSSDTVKKTEQDASEAEATAQDGQETAPLASRIRPELKPLLDEILRDYADVWAELAKH